MRDRGRRPGRHGGEPGGVVGRPEAGHPSGGATGRAAFQLAEVVVKQPFDRDFRDLKGAAQGAPGRPHPRLRWRSRVLQAATPVVSVAATSRPRLRCMGNSTHRYQLWDVLGSIPGIRAPAEARRASTLSDAGLGGARTEGERNARAAKPCSALLLVLVTNPD